jgi:hypothetical protein
MTTVKVITVPSLEGKRRAFLLVEDRIGHYPEFRAFFANTFDLERVGLREPGYVAAPSGTEYAFVFIGRSGEPFPAGVEIYALARRWSRSTRRRSTAISGKSCGGWSSAWAAPGRWPIWKRPADCFGFPGVPTDREDS